LKSVDQPGARLPQSVVKDRDALFALYDRYLKQLPLRVQYPAAQQQFDLVSVFAMLNREYHQPAGTRAQPLLFKSESR